MTEDYYYVDRGSPCSPNTLPQIMKWTLRWNDAKGSWELLFFDKFYSYMGQERPSIPEKWSTDLTACQEELVVILDEQIHRYDACIRRRRQVLDELLTGQYDGVDRR